MRKTLFVVSLLLIIVAIGGPAVIGHLVESTAAREQKHLANAMPPWAEIVAQEFQRGWFGSRSTYRILITESAPPAVRELLGAFGGFGDQPALIVDSNISHGPLVGVFIPAAVSADSQFFLETGDAPRVQLPMLTRSLIGLTGNLTIDWQMAGATLENNGTIITWAPMSGRAKLFPSKQRLETSIRTDLISSEAIGGPSLLTLVDSELDAIVDVEDALVSVTVDYDVNVRATDEAGYSGVFHVHRLPVASIPGLQQLIADARQALPPVDWRIIGSRHLPTLHQLISQSPTLDWTQQVITSEGATDSDLTIDLIPASSPDIARIEIFVEDLVQRMKATLDFSAPVARVEDMAVNSTFIATVRSMGMLEKDQDKQRYNTKMSYAAGMMTVNGLPVPVMPNDR